MSSNGSIPMGLNDIINYAAYALLASLRLLYRIMQLIRISDRPKHITYSDISNSATYLGLMGSLIYIIWIWTFGNNHITQKIVFTIVEVMFLIMDITTYIILIKKTHPDKLKSILPILNTNSTRKKKKTLQQQQQILHIGKGKHVYY